MTITNLLILLANLAIFGLHLKLYTEILKDQAQNRRSDRMRSEQEGSKT